jgi:hypothetical protein
VPAFELFREYSRADVLARLGDGRKSGAFFVAGNRAACFVELSTEAGGPSFPERSTFHWPARCPEVICASGLSVALFVRRAGDSFLFLHVGEARVTSYSNSDSARPRDVRFHLRTALPRERWLELREATTTVKVRGVVAEAEIARLTPASSTADRMQALFRFVEEWHGCSVERPSAAADTLPPPLVAFHRLAGQVPGLIVQNMLEAPDDPMIDGGHLVFYVENQGVCLWATEPQGEDPPVWWRVNEPGEAWQLEEEPLSGFLIQLTLFEAILGAPVGASTGSLGAEQVARLCATMTPLPLGAWRWNYPTRFYARDGALLFVAGDEEDAITAYVAAREPEALSFMADLIDESWDQVSF